MIRQKVMQFPVTKIMNIQLVMVSSILYFFTISKAVNAGYQSAINKVLNWFVGCNWTDIFVAK